MSIVNNLCSAAKIIAEYCIDSSEDLEKDKIRHVIVGLFKQHVLDSFAYGCYVINSDLHVKNMRQGGRFNAMTILTYSDGSEWVVLNDKPKERFCGFLYLQSALQGARSVAPASNKMALYGANRQILYLSQYYGEVRPSIDSLLALSEHIDLRDSKTRFVQAGFIDSIGGNNVSIYKNALYIFDTPKHSFKPEVHPKIDAFSSIHDEIRSLLEAT